MKITNLARVLALAAGFAACLPAATAGARWDWAGDRVAVQRGDREQLVYLDPEQRREMRQQMREQWRQTPPRQDDWRQDFRERRQERQQQLPPDDRFRMREDLRGQRGERHWHNVGGGRR